MWVGGKLVIIKIIYIFFMLDVFDLIIKKKILSQKVGPGGGLANIYIVYIYM